MSVRRNIPWYALAPALLVLLLHCHAFAGIPVFADALNTAPPSSSVNSTNKDEANHSQKLGPWTAELVRLAEAGLDEEVLLHYIDNTEGTFNLDAGSLALLRNLTVSETVLAFVIKHDADIRSGARQLIATTVPSSGFPLTKPAGTAAGQKLIKREKALRETIIVKDWDEDSATTVEPLDAESTAGEFAASPVSELSRVRSRAPVPLTSTILLYRAVPRAPNLISIYPLP